MKIVTVQDIAQMVKKHTFNKFIFDLIEYLKEDFSRWGEFDKSPRHATHVDGGVIELMPIADNNYYTFKYVNGHPKNPTNGLQTVIATGQLSIVENGYPKMYSEMSILTGIRTAATAMIATDLLARKDSTTLAIIGTGAQSEFQIRAHILVRPIKTVKYYDTDLDAMVKFEKNMKTFGLNLIACTSAEEAVKNADIIIVCTACKGHVKVIHNDWVKPGVHINGLGGDCPGKTELDIDILFRSKIVVEYTPQSLIEGEIQLLSTEYADKLVHAELWEILVGRKSGRINNEEITVFDSVGFALEDYSVLRLTYDLVNQYNFGHELDLVPLIKDPKDLISALGGGYGENKINLIGAAIDACAGTKGSADTPDILAKKWLPSLGLEFEKILSYTGGRNDVLKLEKYFTDLALQCQISVESAKFPIVIGGDHSCAIGSWSGIAKAYSKQRLGLIWLDAHMDSHTPSSSISGNIHGMPVAVLLGEGYVEFTHIMGMYPKIRPEDIVLIGIRSYEVAERDILERLGVKVYYIEEVNHRGFIKVFDEAWSNLTKTTDKIGLSIDLDGFDPYFAPGVGTQEPNGINLPDCIVALKKLNTTKLAGLEITEGNDHLDPSGKTLDCIVEIIQSILR